jgi:hypothetical protein
MTRFFPSGIRTLSSALVCSSRGTGSELSFTAAALIVACMTFVVSGCAVTPWGRNHPLSGRIWDVSAARFIDRQSLVTRMARAHSCFSARGMITPIITCCRPKCSAA